MGERHTLCHMCGELAKHTCNLCGRHVCEKHFHADIGICSSCKAGRH